MAIGLGGIIASSLVGGALGLVGSNRSANAAEEAAQRSLEATRESIDFQRESRDMSIGMSEPWRRQGENALNALAYVYGLGPRPTQQVAYAGGVEGGGPRERNVTVNVDASDVNYLRDLIPLLDEEERLEPGGTFNSQQDFYDYLMDGVDPFRGEGNQLSDLRAAEIARISQEMDANNGTFTPTISSTGNVSANVTETSSANPSTMGGSQMVDAPYRGPQRMSDFYRNLEADVFGRDFETSPGYEFRLNEGMNAMDRTASARGMRLSGAALRAAQDYGQGMATNEFGNWYNRNLNEFNRRSGAYQNEVAGINALAGVGGQTAQQQGQIAMNTGANVGNTLMAGAAQQGQALQNAGNARASGYAAANNAVQSGIQNLWTMNMFNALNPGVT